MFLWFETGLDAGKQVSGIRLLNDCFTSERQGLNNIWIESALKQILDFGFGGICCCFFDFLGRLLEDGDELSPDNSSLLLRSTIPASLSTKRWLASTTVSWIPRYSSAFCGHSRLPQVAKAHYPPDRESCKYASTMIPLISHTRTAWNLSPIASFMSLAATCFSQSRDSCPL